ncbi:hypothetical protein [Kribbella sp. NPDC048928]|uniref:hypothetical protein n=1 Tax=Kribbella sp. NPDC048928 TaxID=3364111 RepID=UPI003711E5A0
MTYRARFWSVVRCYPTADGLVWFKENNPGHRFEAGLVAALSELAESSAARLGDLASYGVIVPLAVDRERGRMLTDDCGPTLTHADVEDQPTRRIVVQALARLQCAVLGRIEPEDHPGMIELPPTSAGNHVRAIAREWSTLQPIHPLRTEPDVLVRAERAADVLDQRTASLSDSVPLDVEFNDVYPANIFADRSTGVLRPRFFDFGNALWAHPFVTLHGFLDAVVEWNCAPLSHEDREELLDIYLAVWRERLDADPAVLRRDLDVTEALVGVHRLVSWSRLIPYADELELRTRAEIPLKYLATTCAIR